MIKNPQHPFHLVDPSPWPAIAAWGALLLTIGLLKWFYAHTLSLLLLALSSLALTTFQWWRDISRERAFQGLHTQIVQKGLQWGIILFIVSEICFFFSFFWAFFHRRLSPCLELGRVWPPTGLQPFDPFRVPLLNTAILLASGATVTWAHHALLQAQHSEAQIRLRVTLRLGFYFTLLQGFEYYEARFTIADSVYGATFFVATGFHGLHVIIGTLFLSVCFTRLCLGHFSPTHHFGFEAAAWYWHFVDVVWLFLYISIYWWGR